MKTPIIKRLIFIGSFDPPHIAHREILKSAIQKIRPDYVEIILTEQKSIAKPRRLLSAKQRLICARALFGDLHPQPVIRSDFTNSNSVRLDQFIDRNQHEQIFILLGEDKLPNLVQSSKLLSARIHCLVAPRLSSAQQLRQRLRRQFREIAQYITVLPATPANVRRLSSTLIKEDRHD